MDQKNGDVKKEPPPDFRPMTEKETLDFLESTIEHETLASKVKQISAEIEMHKAKAKALEVDLLETKGKLAMVQSGIMEQNKTLKIKQQGDIERFGDRYFVRVRKEEPEKKGTAEAEKTPLAENAPQDLSKFVSVKVVEPK